MLHHHINKISWPLRSSSHFLWGIILILLWHELLLWVRPSWEALCSMAYIRIELGLLFIVCWSVWHLPTIRLIWWVSICRADKGMLLHQRSWETLFALTALLLSMLATIGMSIKLSERLRIPAEMTWNSLLVFLP